MTTERRDRESRELELAEARARDRAERLRPRTIVIRLNDRSETLVGAYVFAIDRSGVLLIYERTEDSERMWMAFAAGAWVHCQIVKTVSDVRQEAP